MLGCAIAAPSDSATPSAKPNDDVRTIIFLLASCVITIGSYRNTHRQVTCQTEESTARQPFRRLKRPPGRAPRQPCAQKGSVVPSKRPLFRHLGGKLSPLHPLLRAERGRNARTRVCPHAPVAWTFASRQAKHPLSRIAQGCPGKIMHSTTTSGRGRVVA